MTKSDAALPHHSHPDGYGPSLEGKGVATKCSALVLPSGYGYGPSLEGKGVATGRRCCARKSLLKATDLH